MDPIQNPFSPGAGAPPPELVGRNQILDQAKILFGRTIAGRPEKSMIPIGLRNTSARTVSENPMILSGGDVLDSHCVHTIMYVLSLGILSF
jgi:hypothetical protein